MTKTAKTKTLSYVPRPSACSRLALHVLKQALDDVSNRRRVNIEDLKPWAFIAGIPQRSLELSFQETAGLRRKGALS